MAFDADPRVRNDPIARPIGMRIQVPSKKVMTKKPAAPRKRPQEMSGWVELTLSMKYFSCWIQVSRALTIARMSAAKVLVSVESLTEVR